jgi:hypothetical protein
MAVLLCRQNKAGVDARPGSGAPAFPTNTNAYVLRVQLLTIFSGRRGEKER